jgi:FkbM family methyltransferase
MNRFPSKSNSLHFLKSLGVEIGTVLDVGTHEQTPELRLAFPAQRHILFEPAEEFYPAIAKHYEGLNYELVKAAVSNSDGVGRLKKTAIDGGDVSHSTLVWGDSASDTDVATIRLDTFLQARNEPKPYLLKIDVDGFEIPILEGTEGAWGDIDCVIIEATQVTFLERLQFVISRGFRLFDIVDQCYYSGVFSQADLVFVADRVFQRNAALRPWETQEFAWSKWIPVASFESSINPE